MFEKYAWLIILTLVQAVLIAFKIIENKNGKKKGNPTSSYHPCAQHGERLANLEARTENVEKGIERIERKLNGN
jgi:hypothetical protein